MMLQQTQVDRVLPKYEEWLRKYPSVEALAAARPGDVGRTWRPLGYNARPRRLHAIAREVVARYDAKIPSDEETLRSFTGIGAYTAGAVQSFAFGRRAPIVDTNVARVLSRVFVGGHRVRRGVPGDQVGNAAATRKRLWALSEALLPRREVFDFNQALMDLGAMVCVARRPRCPVCPMCPICTTYPFSPDGPDKEDKR
jgi:A/G-specific adenine glycosylase